jgi:hypothetical protein
VYVATGAGHFDPTKNALVFSAGSEPELPMSRDERRAYERQFKSLLAETGPGTSPKRAEKAWARLESHAATELNDDGQPFFQLRVEEEPVTVGATAGNVLSSDAPPLMAQGLLEARLRLELRRKSQRFVTDSDVVRDWRLLQQALAASKTDTQFSRRSAVRTLEPASLRDLVPNSP